ncbi:MAG: RNA polymerase subunit sigma [Nitrospinae bacterium CG11_big_fil_rev_8_21_14_0_20_45_15]|nr:MAG: RNA polymerase subunit sigma [Nitrospinae bacterium CG11_big_fil_rev_8_21_14_0_20_45_15]
MTLKNDKPDKENYGLDQDALSRYMHDIGKIQPLSKEEECKLVRSIKDKNDLFPLQELVRRNLKYVVNVANKYRGCGLSLQDLIEEGNIGLVQAAKRFDPDREVRFITYAVWWIRQAILHALSDHAHPVRIPVKQAGKISKIGKSFNRLSQTLDREPTQEELAISMDMKEDEIETLLRAYRTQVSLDCPLRQDNDTPYLDLLENADAIPYDDQIMQETLSIKIDHFLKDLNEREEKILRLRFGFDGPAQTLEEIGKEMGLSRERIRQIEKKAKSRLKLRAQLLYQDNSVDS